MRQLLILFAGILIVGMVQAQSTLRGKVMDSKSDMGLDGATIFNTTLGLFRKAGQDGMFSIRANENDVLIFSSTGYKADTVRISADILATGLFLGLRASPISLDTVTVTQRTYSDDSLQRRLDYAHFFENPPKDITGGNTPQYGAGITLSPFTYFSKEERNKRRFRKQFEEYERNAYIDYRFSPSYVHRLTGLNGEALQQFLRKYRPSYEYLRGATQQDLLLYINDSLIKFRKRRTK